MGMAYGYVAWVCFMGRSSLGGMVYPGGRPEFWMLVIAWWEVFTLAVLADLMTLALMRTHIVVCEHGLAVNVIVIVIVIMRSRCLSGLQGLGDCDPLL